MDDLFEKITPIEYEKEVGVEEDIPSPKKITSDSANNIISNIESFSIGNGAKSIHLEKQGIWVGAEKFDDAPFSISIIGEVKDVNKEELTEEEIFLEAHPISSFYITTDSENPNIRYGGTWTLFVAGSTLLGVNMWERTA